MAEASGELFYWNELDRVAFAAFEQPKLFVRRCASIQVTEERMIARSFREFCH